MNQNIIILFLSLALTISLAGNIYNYQTNRPLESKPLISMEKITEAKPAGIQPKAKNSELLSVYVLPHPPDFLEGRRIFFKDYKIQNSENKQIIIFNERNNNEWVVTKVDSEAVRWK